jgi:hypothetical protein
LRRVLWAIVVLQLHDPGRRIVPLELEDVADARAAPAVDRLVGIARHGEIRVVDREAADDGVLDRVRVLVFVDEDEAVAGVERRPQLGILGQEPGEVHEQVVEVDGVGRQQQLLVDRPERAGHLVGRPPPARLERLGREQVVLGPGDHPGDPIDRRVGQGEAELFDGPLEDGRRVVGIKDRVVAGQAHLPGVSPQQPGGEAVKGPHLDGLRPDQFGHPAPHLVGGLVGEGERHNRGGGHPHGDQVGHALGDDPGLAAARPCQHQQRPLDVGGGLTLGLVQAVEK